jgi:transcriptional regulator with XRE-family HTH domain
MLNTKQYAKNIGLAIKSSREQLGITQAELAELIGTNRSYLSGVETGSRSPGLVTMVLIATALKLSFSELIRRAENIAVSSVTDQN